MNELLGTFRAFRQILCICPCCGEIQRLSDFQLRYKGNVKETWLDEYHHKELLLQKKEDRLAEKENELREKARERGRKKAEQMVTNAISPSYRRLGFNPYDIKPVYHPVDFLVFDGMNSTEQVEKIVLLSKACKNPALNKIRASIKEAVLKKKYDWQVLRATDAGELCHEC